MSQTRILCKCGFPLCHCQCGKTSVSAVASNDGVRALASKGGNVGHKIYTILEMWIVERKATNKQWRVAYIHQFKSKASKKMEQWKLNYPDRKYRLVKFERASNDGAP